MSGHKKSRDLVESIYEDPVRRARVEEPGRAYDALVALHESSETGGSSQADVARDLSASQPYVVKPEKRGDMSLTALSIRPL